MIHPDTDLVHISSDLGRGILATANIPRGTLVWVRDRFDWLMSARDVEQLDTAHRRLLDKWGYRDSNGHWVLCSDIGRFVNHSCAPTMRSLGDDLMIAVRDISVGEEVTCDYAECNVSLKCACQRPGCRHTISPTDVFEHTEQWDAEIRGATSCAASVPQPLLRYAIDWKRFLKWTRAEKRVPSVTDLYFSPHAA